MSESLLCCWGGVPVLNIEISVLVNSGLKVLLHEFPTGPVALKIA